MLKRKKKRGQPPDPARRRERRVVRRRARRGGRGDPPARALRQAASERNLLGAEPLRRRGDGAAHDRPDRAAARRPAAVPPRAVPRGQLRRSEDRLQAPARARADRPRVSERHPRARGLRLGRRDPLLRDAQVRARRAAGDDAAHARPPAPARRGDPRLGSLQPAADPARPADQPDPRAGPVRQEPALPRRRGQVDPRPGRGRRRDLPHDRRDALVRALRRRRRSRGGGREAEPRLLLRPARRRARDDAGRERRLLAPAALSEEHGVPVRLPRQRRGHRVAAARRDRARARPAGQARPALADAAAQLHRRHAASSLEPGADRAA